ncbi:hypothetical protein, partial [Mesorhizobium japonicum]|uniref:hypothetical protein n=1 Tax=Mesorhizobium japonicum TaxID=2066070 RepID=UPI003B5BD6CC
AVWLGGGSSYLIKGPVDVSGYLFTDGSGSGSPESRRAALLPMIGVTLAHAGIGLALGGGLALLGSIAISLSRLARTAV